MGYDPIDLKLHASRKVWVNCGICGKGRLLPYRDRDNLCGSCSMVGRFAGDKHPNWKGGITNAPYCEKFNDSFKEKIRNLFNRLCFLCGMDEEENGQKLSVHHTNYDKDCLCNSNCEFVPLCTKCHGKTNYQRQYWEDLIMCYLYPDRITMIDL